MISERLEFKKSKYGYYLIILASALTALVHVISKPMLENSENIMPINPIVLAFLVYFIGGIFFTPIAKKTDSISKFGKKDWMFMGAIGISEVAALIAYFYGLSASTAVNASIFSNSEMVFALVIGMMAFREKLRIKECIPFSMIIIGMMAIPIGNDLFQNNFSLGEMLTGDLLIILSGILYGVDITLCKYVGDRFDARRVTQIVSFVCAAVAISLIVVLQIPMNVDLMQVPSILALSILGTGMSTLFFLMALKFIGTMRTVLLYSTTAIFGVIFSGLLLAETVTMMDIVSLTLVMVGIFMLRNRLSGNEDEEKITITTNIRKRKTRRKKNGSKISILDRIQDEYISKKWIGAG
jgi:drug/metabolite transporter (DMT)-like permease